MTDNRQIKDGLGNLFTIRMRDFSAAQDGTEQRSMILATAYPVEYGNGGSYHRSSKSNVLAANMAAQAPVYSFQWTSTTMLAVIRRVRMSAWSADTGFVAGLAMFDMTMARAFTTQLTGGTAVNLAGNTGKMKTAMASSQANIMHSQTIALSGGVYTLDPGLGNIDTWVTSVGVNPYTPVSVGPLNLFERMQGEMPLLLAQNEGFLLRATVPQTGTWSFSIAAEWDEIPPASSY